MYHLQLSLQTAGPETFGYTLVSEGVFPAFSWRRWGETRYNRDTRKPLGRFTA